MTCKYEGCTAKEMAREIEDGTRPAKIDDGLTSGVEVG